MKTSVLRPACLLLPLLFTAVARAAYEPAIVAADARWVVHADLNGLRASTLGKELVAAVETAQKQATGGVIGIDVPKLLATVGTLTAYGTNFLADPTSIDGTLIAQGTADLRKIAESLLLQGTLAQPEVFAEATDLPFPAYEIRDPKAKSENKTHLLIAFPPEPIVIVSKSKAQLVKARDVFRGAAPSLAKVADSPLKQATARGEGVYLFAASVVPNETALPPNSPHARILQLTRSGAASVGERGEDTFAHAELLASSDANAEKLMKILQGMTSMLGLAETNDRQLAEFLHSTAVTREKNTVTLDLAYSSARLAQMVQQLRTQAQAEGKPASRKQTIVMGRVLDEWISPTATDGENAPEPATHSVESVKLANGSVITIGRSLNGGRNARFTRVEIVPADGGTPMTFRPDFMRNVRGSMWQLLFPGVDGVYTVRLTYVPDPDGKAKFALSVNDPQSSPPAK